MGDWVNWTLSMKKLFRVRLVIEEDINRSWKELGEEKVCVYSE